MPGYYYNRSYFIGVDAEHGWGNTSYFSFFSEFNRPWDGLPYVEATILILLFIFSMVGNGAVFTQILNIKSTRTVTNYLICNLAFADIFFSCGSPFIAVARISGTWVLGTFICKLLVYLMFICASIMIWTMTIISIDRYICINKISSRKITPRTAIAIIVGIWITVLLSFIPLFTYFTVKSFPFGSSEIQICTLMWPYSNTIRISVIFTATICIAGFAIPLIILVHNYYRILLKFWKSRRTVLNASERTGSNSMKQRKSSRNQRDLKIIQTLVLVVIMFLIMWSPIFIVFILIQADGMSESMKLSSQALIGTLCVALCNACVNPFLYGMMNDRLKKTIIACFSCKQKIEMNVETESRTENSGGVKAISYSHNSFS